jgi:hypothetical protein
MPPLASYGAFLIDQVIERHQLPCEALRVMPSKSEIVVSRAIGFGLPSEFLKADRLSVGAGHFISYAHNLDLSYPEALAAILG